MSSDQNMKCGWSGCSHKFGSEIDMNMHVLMNHMSLLQYGTFKLNRREVSRKRPARESSLEVVESEQLPTQKKAEATTAPESSSRAAEQPILSRVSHGLERNSEPAFNQQNGSVGIENLLRLISPQIPIPPNLDIPAHFPGSGPSNSEMSNGRNAEAWEMAEVGDEREDSNQSMHSDDEQRLLDIQEQLSSYLENNPQKLSDVINEFICRLRPMTQLGFIRPQRPVYCVVCLKYVKSYQECNWKHSAMEDRVVEMWHRRFGKERPTGKNQLISELNEIRELVLEQEALGIMHKIDQ